VIAIKTYEIVNFFVFSSTANASSAQQFPETLEELLIKKWQLGAEFVMEQSEHFDSE
jgi:hypothetical protein